MSLTGTVGGPEVPLLSIDAALANASLLPAGGRLALGTAGPPQTVLHVEGDEGVHSGGTGGGFSFADRTVGGFVGAPTAGQRWVWYASGGTARLWSGRDLLTVGTTGEGLANASLLPAGGRLALGTAGPPQTVLHVEGDEGVHSGGTGGGFSFADRTVGGFVGAPTAGQRWVWYASGGTARLWSGRDLLTVGTTGEGLGLDVARRMRVRQGGDASAGLWFFQDGTASDRAFVGMANDSEVGFYGVGVGWGLKMNVTSNGAVSIPNNLSVGNTGDAANNIALSVTSGPGGAICAISQTGTAMRAVSSNGTGLWVGGFTELTGDVDITGRLVGGGKQFKIDHPLDPENRYLAHMSIESSEQLTCYSGNVVLDDDGAAEVRLPDWTEALVTDFRYQLTCISRSEPVYISREVTDGNFAIAGGTAGLKVSWQLTGVRHDVWAQANELVVEEDKAEAERGYYRHPEAFGHGLERSVHWPRNEELIRQHPQTAQHFVRAQALKNAERVAAQAARRDRTAER